MKTYMQALDEHVDMARWWGSEAALHFSAWFLRECGMNPTAEKAAQFAYSLSWGLDVSTTFAVTSDMAALVEHAAPTFLDGGPLIFSADDFPSRHGFVMFEQTLGGLGEPFRIDCINWILSAVRDDAVSYTIEEGSSPEEGEAGVIIGFHAKQHEGPGGPFALTRPPYQLWAYTPHKFGPVDETNVPDYNLFGLTLFKTFLTLVQQRVPRTERQIAGRAQQRRLERAVLPQLAPEVRVITLRKEMETPTVPTNDPQIVHWTHRWMVDSFWRNQPYGPHNSLRYRKWIAPHIRGPEHLPLVLKDKVYRWSR